MTYKEAMTKAALITSYAEADELLREIEKENTITDKQYYNVRRCAIDAAYMAATNEKEG